MNDSTQPQPDSPIPGTSFICRYELGDDQQGLLDLRVELSTRDVTAGKQFAVFVLVKNPFKQAIWIDRVHVSLPIDLKLAIDEKSAIERLFDKIRPAATESQISLKHKKYVQKVEDELRSIRSKMEKSAVSDEMLRSFSQRLDDLVRHVADPLSANIDIRASKIKKMQVSADKSNTSLRDTSIDELEILDSWLVAQQRAKAREIELQSSLPAGTALQPSSTVVYTAVLLVRKSLTFAPASYRMQFNVNYSFTSDETRQKSSMITNATAFELNIRPSLGSMITGGAAGACFGSLARMLKNSPHVDATLFTWVSIVTGIIPLALSIILGSIAIVFIARKSDAQSFISVEDFWGGLLVGFFVGYTGTEFFGQLTHFDSLTKASE